MKNEKGLTSVIEHVFPPSLRSVWKRWEQPGKVRETALKVVTLEKIDSFDVEFFVAGLILEASIYSLLTKIMPESMQMPFQINVLSTCI